jgi:hypothetical protein
MLLSFQKAATTEEFLTPDPEELEDSEIIIENE